jgi:hypothetical protein
MIFIHLLTCILKTNPGYASVSSSSISLSYADVLLHRPRPRGPSDPKAVGPRVSSKQNKKDGQSGKKDGKKDSNTQLPHDATKSKEDTGEAKGPSTHTKS